MCGDRFIQGTALKQHQRMQNHTEGSQPSPYASISVNNPSRFTNSNLVNRRYMEQQAQQQSSQQNSQMPIKPVIPRRRTANNSQQHATSVNPVQNQMIQQTTSTMSNQPQMSQEHQENDLNRSSSPHTTGSSQHSTGSQTPNSASQDIKPNLQNLNLPQYNGSMPLVSNIPNMEIATLFTMSFNQNFQNHSN